METITRKGAFVLHDKLRNNSHKIGKFLSLYRYFFAEYSYSEGGNLLTG
jgi:hypothetical protein